MNQQFTKLRAKWRQEQQTRIQRSTAIRRILSTRGVAVFEAFGLQKVVLFGSVLTHRSTPTSDIDLLVVPLSAVDYWKFHHELEQSLGYPVDIYTQEDDPVFVQKNFATRRSCL